MNFWFVSEIYLLYLILWHVLIKIIKVIFRFYNVQPSKDFPEFVVSFVFEDDQGNFSAIGRSSEKILLSKFSVKEPFLLWNPEYSFSPSYLKRYPVIVGDWNLNFYIVLQNINKFSVIFTDGVGSQNLSGRIPAKVVGVPLFVLYVDVFLKENLSSVMKKKKIDILFVGSLNPGIHQARNRLLKKILTIPEDYRVVVASGLYNNDLYSDLLSKSKIVFNYSVRNEMNMRVFEAMKTACCLFLEDNNIETWWYIRKFEDAVAYNEANLIDLVLRYIQDDNERERVAVSGYNSMRKITKSYVYKKIWEEIKDGVFDTYNSNFISEVSSFRSFVNHLFNFPICINDQNLDYAENWGLSLAEKSDTFVRSSVLSDLSFMYTISASKIDDTNKKRYMLDKAIKYINSAVAFSPRSLIYWYNLAFLNYSAKNIREFQIACSNFLKIASTLSPGESMKEIRGYPEPFSPIIFSHYTFFKSYIDLIWVQNFEKTDFLRNEILKVLMAQLYFFLSNVSLDYGDLKESENFCNQAINIFQGFSALYYLLGKIKMAQGDFQSASLIYTKAYEMDPFFVDKWPEVLSALLLSGNKDKFEDVLKEMKLISKRLYIFSGRTLSLSVGQFQENIVIKSIRDLINEYILENENR